MKRTSLLAGFAIALAAVGLIAAANDRYINGTAIPREKVLVYTTGSQAITAGAVSATTVTASSNVSVAGTLAVTGALSTAAGLTYSTTETVGLSAAVAATGTSKTDCTALTASLNVVTSATALQGVCLLTAAAGLHQKVVNETAVSIYVYPLDAGNDTLQVDNFSALAADAPWVVGPLGSIDCYAYTTTAWQCKSTWGAQAAVAATGSSQATGTALTSVNMNSEVTVTAANGAKAITLMTGTDPGCVKINSQVFGATAPSGILNFLLVYGNNSDNDTINGASADAVYNHPAGSSLKYCTTDGVAWVTY